MEFGRNVYNGLLSPWDWVPRIAVEEVDKEEKIVKSFVESRADIGSAFFVYILIETIEVEYS